MINGLEKALGRLISQKSDGGLVLACVIAYSAVITHHSISRTQQSEQHILGHCYATNDKKMNGLRVLQSFILSRAM